MSLSWAEKWTELFTKLLFECLKYSTIFLNVQSLSTKICRPGLEIHTMFCIYIAVTLTQCVQFTVLTVYSRNL